MFDALAAGRTPDHTVLTAALDLSNCHGIDASFDLLDGLAARIPFLVLCTVPNVWPHQRGTSLAVRPHRLQGQGLKLFDGSSLDSRRQKFR